MENKLTERVFTNQNMLAWMGTFAEKMEISPEKIKLLNVCGKKKNVIPSIETHKRVMIFVDESHEDLLYEFWEAGFGEYDMWIGHGLEPNEEIQQVKIKNVINKKIAGPTVLFVVNENTRESYRIGIKNEYFSRGPVHYVGNEIRAVIMSLLGVDQQDCIAIVNGESIVIEAAIAASEGTILAVEPDESAMQSMEENVDKFGVHNVEIITDLEKETLEEFPVPRLAFIVASPNLEQQIQNLLARNPKMQFVIYTLELDMLSNMKSLFKIYGISNMEILQISVSKTNSKSMFVAQPSPWLITGEAE